VNWVNAIVQGVFLGGLYALFACGLSTGLGAAINTAQVSAGSTCVVIPYP